MLFWILCFGYKEVWGFDPNIVHPHPPILQPFMKTPKPVALSARQETKLNAGEMVFIAKKTTSGSQGRGIAVQYINAPEEIVWNMVLSYEHYPERVQNVVRASVYEQKEDVLYVALISQVLWIEFGLYTINTIHREKNYMSWQLDRRRMSDVEDIIGYWRIVQIAEDPPRTRVDFASELSLQGVPEFLEDYLREDSLRNGTAWVKKYAEKAYREEKK